VEKGTQVQLSDLTAPPIKDRESPRPELKVMPLDSQRADSPLVLFDLQPLWTKQDIRNQTYLLFSVFAVIMFIVSGITSMSILRSISRAIKTLEKDTAIVATGKLDHEVAGSANHEILQLAKSINLMRLNLKDMLLRRSKMLMGISHDLKTPITLIQGYADALADNFAVDAKTREAYIQIIQNKAKQLEDLTGELIDFLKIGGDGSISVEEVDLAELLRSLGERFDSDARLLHRTLAWGYGEEALKEPTFQAGTRTMNRLLVERAIENLIANAFKYTKEGGNISLRLLPQASGLAFSVTDDGPGIGEEDLPYVFDAFYRASPSRADPGHGFGLTIVKAVADLHGWTVSIGKRRDGLGGTEVLLSLS